jgi:hypothetical protein
MKRQDENEMKMLYREWMDSGKSRAVFATEKGIVRTTFYYWVSKFSKQETLPSGNKGFSLLTIGDTLPAPSVRTVACIRYPSGVRVELYGDVTAGFIRELAL